MARTSNLTILKLLEVAQLQDVDENPRYSTDFHLTRLVTELLTFTGDILYLKNSLIPPPPFSHTKKILNIHNTKETKVACYNT